MKRRKTFNPKRQFRSQPVDVAARDALAAKVQYGGNPEHKRNPGDFKLTPPASPRPGKTLCDGAGIVAREDAVRLLREGIKRGLMSDRDVNGWPKYVWAVWASRVPVEAVLENEATGTYHGYPLQSSDPLASEVILRWATGSGEP